MIVITKIQKVIHDLQEIQKIVYPGKTEVQRVTKILAKKLEQGIIYPEEITLDRLMLHGLTEVDSEHILINLRDQGIEA